MPIIKSAQKSLRQTKKRTVVNRSKKIALKNQINEFKTKKTDSSLRKIYSSIDKLAKSKIFHKNKAARIKSRLAKLLSS